MLLAVLVMSCHHQTTSTSFKPKYVSDATPRPHQISSQVYYLDTLREKYATELAKRKVDLSKVETRVFWSKEQCGGKIGLLYTEDDVPGCYWGLTYSCTEIYVVEVTPISRSAFIHELGHCYYRGVYGKRDTLHTDTVFWNHVEKVKDDLRNRGW